MRAWRAHSISAMTSRAAVAVVLALGLSPAAAQAQVVSGVTGPMVQGWLQDMGYRAELTTDSVGDPLIYSVTSGTNFSIWFYGCDDTAVETCNSIQFYAGYDLAQGTSAQVINNFNREWRFAKAYYDDEKDPILKLDLSFFGGVSRGAFEDYLDIWETTVAEFETAIGW